MEIKELLIQILKNRGDAIINDVRSYQYLKTDLKNEYKLAATTVNSYIGIGGGNFLATLGMFCAIDFYSQSYYVLKNNWPIKSNNNLLKKIINSISYIFLNNKIEYNYELNHLKCFRYFLRSSSLKKEWEKYDLKKIWDYYRNNLVHMINPQDVESSLPTVKRITFNNYENNKPNLPTFRNQNGRLICNCDQLLSDLSLLQIELIESINHSTHDSVKRTLCWLELNNP